MYSLLQDSFLTQLDKLTREGAAVFFDDISPRIPLREVHIVLDSGTSMASMREQSHKCVASIAWLALAQNLVVRFIPFNDVPRLSIPPFVNTGDYRRLAHALESINNRGKGDLFKACAELQTNPHTLTVVVSDILTTDPISFFELLTTKSTTSFLIHCFDPTLFMPMEVGFQTSGATQYESSTTVAEIKVFMQSIDRMATAKRMPTVRISRRDGWLELAHYLFNWLGYRHVG